MKKIFILGASSKLAKKFILSSKIKNLSFFFTYNNNNIKNILNIYPNAKSCKIDLTKKKDIEKI